MSTKVLLPDSVSPVKHLYLAWGTGNRAGDTVLLQRICDHVLEEAAVVLVVPEYPVMQIRAPRASIRVCVSAGHRLGDLRRATQALGRAARDVFSGLRETHA